MQEQRKSDVSAKIESQAADDDDQSLLAEVRQLLAECVDSAQRCPNPLGYSAREKREWERERGRDEQTTARNNHSTHWGERYCLCAVTYLYVHGKIMQLYNNYSKQVAYIHCRVAVVYRQYNVLAHLWLLVTNKQCTMDNIPYSGKFLREKIFADW